MENETMDTRKEGNEQGEDNLRRSQGESGQSRKRSSSVFHDDEELAVKVCRPISPIAKTSSLPGTSEDSDETDADKSEGEECLGEEIEYSEEEIEEEEVMEEQVEKWYHCGSESSDSDGNDADESEGEECLGEELDCSEEEVAEEDVMEEEVGRCYRDDSELSSCHGSTGDVEVSESHVGVKWKKYLLFEYDESSKSMEGSSTKNADVKFERPQKYVSKTKMSEAQTQTETPIPANVVHNIFMTPISSFVQPLVNAGVVFVEIMRGPCASTQGLRYMNLTELNQIAQMIQKKIPTVEMNDESSDCEFPDENIPLKLPLRTYPPSSALLQRQKRISIFSSPSHMLQSDSDSEKPNDQNSHD